ncbi:MAG: protein kinase [Phycisphaera sp.]|nr:protein kinase [Phycisphaera sp.]
MGFVVRRVIDLPCPKCGAIIDPGELAIGAPVRCGKCGEQTTVPAQFDHFLVYEKMGKGGFGRVFRARDLRLEREVAIKVLVGDEGEDDEETALKLIKEARTLATLNHPNIVRIYELGEYEKQHFIVMELLNGGSADTWIDIDKPPSERRTLRLGRSVADALRAAQRVRLVHMDVKPGNILFDRDGHARLIDFGTAMVQRKAERKKDGIVGTPYYIAPEVARGKSPDFRSDMYSLGASLFHILTGRPPFQGKSAKEAIRKRFEAPAPPVIEYRPEVNNATAEVIDRMLAFKRQDRFKDYDELIKAFDDALQALKAARKPRPDESDYVDEDSGPDIAHDPLAELGDAVHAPAGAAAVAAAPPRASAPHVPGRPTPAAGSRPASRYAAQTRRTRKSNPMVLIFGIVLLALIGIGVLIVRQVTGGNPHSAPVRPTPTPQATPRNGGGATATTPAPSPISIVSHANDGMLNDAGVATAVSTNTPDWARVGVGGPPDKRHRTAYVYFFALPTLGKDVSRLDDADLRIEYSAKQGNPDFNAAVYAAGMLTEPNVASATYGDGPAAAGTAVQDDFITPATRVGEVRLSDKGRKALAAYINDQYDADGKPTKPWLAIRINPSTTPSTDKVGGYRLRLSEDIGLGAASPELTLTFK